MRLCQPKFPSIDTQPLLGPSQGSGWGPRNCRCHKLSFAEPSWNEGRCCKWQNNQIHVTDCSQIVILPNLPQKSNESPPYPYFFHNNFWDLFIFICFFFGARSQSRVQFLYIPFLYVQSLYSFGRGAGRVCLRGVVSLRASASHLSLSLRTASFFLFTRLVLLRIHIDLHLLRPPDFSSGVLVKNCVQESCRYGS
jgi:hypothetical protein